MILNLELKSSFAYTLRFPLKHVKNTEINKLTQKFVVN